MASDYGRESVHGGIGAKDDTMWEVVFRVGREINDVAGRYDRQTWVYIFVGVLVLGMICMKGFGSRTNY